jgi:uncharacterized protein YbbC (DUF1343 family)
MMFGIDRLLAEPELLKPLIGRRVALLAHPASVTADLTHSIDALVAAGVKVTAMFGPQHGVRGDLQDNMMESPDYTDPVYGVPSSACTARCGGRGGSGWVRSTCCWSTCRMSVAASTRS